MHLLTQFSATDFGTWKAKFDQHQESRDHAGLTLLQMWQGVDAPQNVTCLFLVSDRKRAEDWLDQARASFGLGDAAFLKTAL